MIKYCELIYTNHKDHLSIPQAMGVPSDKQLKGSVLDNLIELSGRICYDSLGAQNSRSSDAYHDHIKEVNHLSVAEHANLTFVFHCSTEVEAEAYMSKLVNIPGLYTRYVADYKQLRITTNARVIWELDQYKPSSFTSEVCLQQWFRISNTIRCLARYKFPLFFKDLSYDKKHVVESAGILLNTPEVPMDEEEMWASFWIGNVSRGLCYDENTDVLTKHGWKNWRCVSMDDEFITLNDKFEIEYQKPISLTNEPWDGDMYKVKSTMVDLLVTPNHRMLIQPIDTQKYKRKEQEFIVEQAKNLLGKRVNYKKNGQWTGNETEYFTLPAVNVSHGKVIKTLEETSFLTKDFVEFLGYFIAEGHLSHSTGSSYQICLTQNTGPKLDKILACLDNLKFSYSIKNNGSDKNKLIKIYNQQLFLYLTENIGNNSSNKQIPLWFKSLSKTYLSILIDAIILGDGTVHKKNGHKVIYTTSKTLANDLQELILKIGLSASIREDNRYLENKLRTDHYNIYPTKTCYIVSIANENSQTPTVNNNGHKHDEIVKYTGRVYCATVPNGTLYVRRNGIPVWCGNTHELVRHKFRTAVSQRSTRYVDEGESSWAWHPLIESHIDDLQTDLHTTRNKAYAFESSLNITRMASFLMRNLYSDWVKFLESKLVESGISKFSARKQARGAARGLLGNALSTEMIFSASLAQWKRMILMRASDAADAEIRRLFVQIFLELKHKYPGHFEGWGLIPSSDGCGESVVFQ